MKVTVKNPNGFEAYVEIRNNLFGGKIRDNVKIDEVVKFVNLYSRHISEDWCGHQFSNMRSLKQLVAITDTGDRVQLLTHRHSVATGGAFPTRARHYWSGEKELPENWVALELNEFKYGVRTIGVIARRNKTGDETATCFGWPETIRDVR